MGEFELRCMLRNHTLRLEVTTQQLPNQFFYAVISPDAMPNEYKVLFETPRDMFEYLEDEQTIEPEIKEPT